MSDNPPWETAFKKSQFPYNRRLQGFLVTSTRNSQRPTLRACLRRGGGPQIGEVTCGESLHLSCKRDQINMRDCMDRRVTPPKRVTSPGDLHENRPLVPEYVPPESVIKKIDYILLSILPFWKRVILTDVPFEPEVLFSSICVSVGSSKWKVTLYDIVLLPVITSVTSTRPRFVMLVRLLSACWRFFAVMLFTNTGAIFSPP